MGEERLHNHLLLERRRLKRDRVPVEQLCGKHHLHCKIRFFLLFEFYFILIQR